MTGEELDYMDFDAKRQQESCGAGYQPHSTAHVLALTAEVRRLREELNQYAEVIQHGKRLPDANMSQDVAFAAFTLGKMEDEIRKLKGERA